MTGSDGAPWWQDWPKFVPGWLAFVATVYTLIRASLNRRHQLSIGPEADAVREQLTLARRLFGDIVAEGRRSDWFLGEERRDTAESLRDLAARRTDGTLRSAIEAVATTWDEAFARAPGAQGPMILWTDQEPTPAERQRSADDQRRFGEQAEVAREGVRQVSVALDRLNKLERRTTGRS
ncbi:hypothetical protein E3E14_16710 [Streptomyces sp. ICN441]|uniref:hypothetical protein n=1 Tax=Streptomyces sp. ICN441 TaxID=2558286 RepID=UPI00106AC3F1|nr:hypothetical protein [Streptomyces sp. ICN441]TFE49006.1 hypothetical protein E3E14_16710 [Streptomyces sp. ICN441]